MTETDRWIENEKAHAQIRLWLIVLTAVVVMSSTWAASIFGMVAAHVP